MRSHEKVSIRHVPRGNLSVQRHCSEIKKREEKTDGKERDAGKGTEGTKE